MTIKTHKKDEKDANRPDSKPQKLAKIMYEGIVRYVKGQKRSNQREKQWFCG
jgi:hypothetical protein